MQAEKIDLILTKSIQRFARNTLDCINYTRILRQLGIGVPFRKREYQTLAAGQSEFMITMCTARWRSLKASPFLAISGVADRCMQRSGRPKFHATGFTVTKKMQTASSTSSLKAEVVREIYERYKGGASLRNLKDWLEETRSRPSLARPH